MDRKKIHTKTSKKDRTAYLGQLSDEVANISKRHELNGWISPGEGYENMNLVLAPDDPTSLDLRVPKTRRVRSVGRNKSSAGASTRKTAMRKFKKAVLIGIRYKGERRELINSVTETKKLSKLLQDFGFIGEQITLVDDTASGDRPTRENILRAIRWMVSDLRPGDSAFLSFYGIGSVSHAGISPLDHIQAGEIKDDLLRDLLITSVTGGVQIFCVCDAGFKTMLDLPFKIWAEDRGIGERQQQHENSSISPELIILSGCKVGQAGPGGSLLPAFTSVLREQFLASTGRSWKDLLIGIRGHIRDSKSSLVPQLCSNVAFDFNDPFSFEKSGVTDITYSPQRMSVDSPQRVSNSPQRQQSISPTRSLANPHFYESAVHHAARMGWTPGAGPPVPPDNLQGDTFNGEHYQSQNGKMQVRVTAPQGCRIELQCEPLGGVPQGDTDPDVVPERQNSPQPSINTQLVAKEVSNSPPRQQSTGQLSSWGGASRDTTPNSIIAAATQERKKKKIKPSLPKVKVKKDSQKQTRIIEEQVQEILAREAEKLYRSKKVRKRTPKPINRPESPREIQKKILTDSRAREKAIESENLELYRRKLQSEAPMRELRERVAADERHDAQKTEYLNRLAKHVERVNNYSKMKISSTPKRKVPPKSPTYELTRQFGIPTQQKERLSPSPPREQSPLRYRVETKAVNEVSKLHTVTNDLLQQHMLQRRVLENQLNNLQEQNSVTTFASERSLTPEMASACVQTIPDAFRKEALLAIANRIDWVSKQPPRTPPPEPTPKPPFNLSDVASPSPDHPAVSPSIPPEMEPVGPVDPIVDSKTPVPTPPPTPIPQPEEEPEAEENPDWDWDEEKQEWVPKANAEEANEEAGDWEWDEEKQEYIWVTAAEEPAAAGDWEWDEEKQEYIWVEAAAAADEAEAAAAGEWEWNEETQDYVWVEKKADEEAADAEAGDWEWDEEKQEYIWVTAAEEPAAAGDWEWDEEKQEYIWVEAAAAADEAEAAAAGEWEWNEETQDYVWVEKKADEEAADAEAGDWEWDEEKQDYVWVVATETAAAEATEENGDWVWDEEQQDWVAKQPEAEQADDENPDWVWDDEKQDWIART
eukprot:TRINITY_DN11913_c0_g1_i3.p1 TRINITY_DN11913_c0_g1~~TRINITY_DN11913_c0_g1_i3.p1  ORF type:complete len:1100 (+),score=288.16 TRINITY_DN11913_c0_g1_i3:105-3404(+)